MTIVEIKEKLDSMPYGYMGKFLRYLVKIGMYKNLDSAKNTFFSYLSCKPNSASYIKRRKISDAFKEWRSIYGVRIKSACKEDVIKDFNKRLDCYWGEEWNGK